MVGKFTAIVLAIFLFSSLTIAKDGNKAHKHDEDTIDIDEPDGYVMDSPTSEEGSGPSDDTERDDEDYASGTGPIIPNSGDGPDIVPVPVTRRPSTRKTTKKPPTHPSLTPCQQLLRSSSPFKDSYVPRCTKTGEYERTQCRGNEECWCVNPEGTNIEGTVKQIHMHSDRPDCEGGSNIKPCVFLRVQREWEQLLGAFNPRCTSMGDFETVQCRERECWCVDSYGQVIDNTMTLLPEKPNCEATTRTLITEPPIVTKVDEPKYVKPKGTEEKNELGHLYPDQDDDEDDGGYETREEETNEVGKEEKSKGEAGAVSSPSIMGQPGILAGIIGGAVVGLLCAILLVMFIVYRTRKKDEGSYALDEPTKARGAYAYQKAPDREFYA